MYQNVPKCTNCRPGTVGCILEIYGAAQKHPNTFFLFVSSLYFFFVTPIAGPPVQKPPKEQSGPTHDFGCCLRCCLMVFWAISGASLFVGGGSLYLSLGRTRFRGGVSLPLFSASLRQHVFDIGYWYDSLNPSFWFEYEL